MSSPSQSVYKQTNTKLQKTKTRHWLEIIKKNCKCARVPEISLSASENRFIFQIVSSSSILLTWLCWELRRWFEVQFSDIWILVQVKKMADCNNCNFPVMISFQNFAGFKLIIAPWPDPTINGFISLLRSAFKLTLNSTCGILNCDSRSTHDQSVGSSICWFATISKAASRIRRSIRKTIRITA